MRFRIFNVSWIFTNSVQLMFSIMHSVHVCFTGAEHQQNINLCQKAVRIVQQYSWKPVINESFSFWFCTSSTVLSMPDEFVWNKLNMHVSQMLIYPPHIDGFKYSNCITCNWSDRNWFSALSLFIAINLRVDSSWFLLVKKADVNFKFVYVRTTFFASCL